MPPRAPSPALVLLAAVALSTQGCHQAVGDRCGPDLPPCEQGLECVEGWCATATQETGLDAVGIDETISTEGPAAPVDVVYDELGVPHVYATSSEDAWLGAGFAMARDRFPQMELRRRAAAGTLSELLGAGDGQRLRQDLMARLLEIRRSAEAAFAALPQDDPARGALEGHARGVSLWLARARSGLEEVPEAARPAVDLAPAEWTPVDSLAIARLDQLGRVGVGADELELHLLVQRGLEAFRSDAPDGDMARRAGFVEDVTRFAPIEATRPWEPAATTGPLAPAPSPLPIVPDEAAEGWRAALAAARDLLEGEAGSAAWAAGGWASRSGGGLLAGSLGGPLALPSRYYLVHVVDVEHRREGGVAGICPAGVPALVAGFSARVAWASAPSRADVVDLYLEQITEGPFGEAAVLRDGEAVALEPFVVEVDGPEGRLARLETARSPGHGPLLPDLASEPAEAGWDEVALALGLPEDGPSDVSLSARLSAAETALQAAEAVREAGEPSRAWVLADRDGEAVAALGGCVPTRQPGALGLDLRTGAGSAPCLVLPGQGGAEATGCVADDLLPGLSAGGSSAAVAAGADLTDATVGDRPFRLSPYLGWDFEPGLRTARLEELAAAFEPRERGTALEAVATLADGQTRLAARLLPALRRAVDRGLEERASGGTHSDLMRLVHDLGDRVELLDEAARRLEAWDGSAPSSADEPGDGVAASIAAVWLSKLADLVLGDELEALEVRPADGLVARALVELVAPSRPLRTTEPGRSESALFDDLRTPSRPESRDERLLRSLDEALAWLETTLGADEARWSWSANHRALVAPSPLAGEEPWPGPALPGSHGSVAGFDPELLDLELAARQGPSGWLGVELAPWGPEAILVVAGGDGANGLEAPSDESLAIPAGADTPPLPFDEDDVAARAVRRVRIEPAP